MSVSLAVPVQALYGAVSPPPPAPPPPPACPPRVTCTPHTDGCTFSAECLRADRMLEARAISEIERHRGELGASDMAVESARSELHRERIESALDRRATVAKSDAAAARYAIGSESFSQPVPGTLAKITPESGLTAAQGLDDAARAAADAWAFRAVSPYVGATETIVVRSRSFIDLFA